MQQLPYLRKNRSLARKWTDPRKFQKRFFSNKDILRNTTRDLFLKIPMVDIIPEAIKLDQKSLSLHHAKASEGWRSVDNSANIAP